MECNINICPFSNGPQSFQRLGPPNFFSQNDSFGNLRSLLGKDGPHTGGGIPPPLKSDSNVPYLQFVMDVYFSR